MQIRSKRMRGRAERLKVKALYHAAFPRYEQMPWWLLRCLFALRRLNATCYYDGDTFCGFTHDIKKGSLHYVMFFAVSEELRGKGYGSAILSHVKSGLGEGAIVLNVERLCEKAENLDERKARMQFYQKNGFFDTGCDIDEVGGTFRVLSTKKELDPSAYLAVFKKISFGLWRPKIRKVDSE